MDQRERNFRTLSDRLSEEEYFYQKDLELIDQMRRELDRGRDRISRERNRLAHWMRCPKCGSQMVERQEGAIVMDICMDCGGLYLDRAELELLLKMNRKDSFIDHLAHWLDRVFTQGFDVSQKKHKDGE